MRGVCGEVVGRCQLSRIRLVESPLQPQGVATVAQLPLLPQGVARAEEREDRLEMKAAEKKRRAEERLEMKAAEQNAAKRLEQNAAAEAVEAV